MHSPCLSQLSECLLCLSAPTACKYMVSDSISLPSTGFFSFFSRLTSFSIGRTGILSLRRWTSLIHARFHVSGATRVVPMECLRFRLRGFLPLWHLLSRRFLLAQTFLTPSPISASAWKLPLPRTHNAQRLIHAHGLGYSPFARHSSGTRSCFPFLRLLRCFNSPRSPLHPIYSDEDTRPPIWWVAPFGYPRI